MIRSKTLSEEAAGTEDPKSIGDFSVDDVDFSEVVRLNWRRVFRICLRITQNEHDAEDAAQDCFLRAFSKLHQFQGKAQISTWLHSIARNCSLMLLRKRRTRQELQIEHSSDTNGEFISLDLADSAPDQLKRVLDVESTGRLMKLITALPITLRRSAELVLLNEQSLEAVGQLLDISNAAVKSRLYRARRRMSQSDKRWSRSDIAQGTSSANRTSTKSAPR